MHPRPLDWFQTERPEVFEFVNLIIENINDNKKHIIIWAPVKCGKRIIVECLTSLLTNYKHLYISSLNRKDVKRQKEELEKYGISLHGVYSDKDADAVIEDIRHIKSTGRNVVSHLDECDYGSGKKQKMSQLFQAIKDDNRVVKLYYSATPEEAIYSKLTHRDDFALLEFTPPDSYRGAKYFLDNNLVFTPEAAFEKLEGRIYFTDHGKKVLRDSITLSKNIATFRVTGKGISSDLLKANKDFLESDARRIDIDDRPITIKIIDANDSFDWENEEVRNGYILNQQKIFIFIINQTCGRGTDLNGWHHRLACWHDPRNPSKSNLNTILQAILRPSYYITNYCEAHGISSKSCRDNGCEPMEQEIRMYVPIISIENAATGNIQAYIAAGGKPPTRTTKGRISAQYDIFEGTFEDANEYIISKGCEAKSLDTYEMQDGLYKSGRNLGIGSNKIENRPVTYDEVQSRMRLQYSRTDFTLIPTYKDLSNLESITWVAIRKVSKQTESVAIATLKTSMYS